MAYYPPSNYSSSYGGIPNIPMPTETATQALTGTIGNIPALQKFAAGVNPNYAAQQGIIGQELQGVVPQDVVGQWQQQAAERGVGTGSPGSPNSIAAYLARFLGGSYGIQQQGMNSANQMAQQNFGFMSPFLATAPAQQAAGQYQAVLNAAPVPSAAVDAAKSAVSQGYGSVGGGFGGGQVSGYHPTATPGPMPWDVGQTPWYGATGPFDTSTPSTYTPNWTQSAWSQAPAPVGGYSFAGTPGGENLFGDQPYFDPYLQPGGAPVIDPYLQPGGAPQAPADNFDLSTFFG